MLIYLLCGNNEAALNDAICRLQHCIIDIYTWMSNNALKLNEVKTEFIIFRSINTYTGEHILRVGNNKCLLSKRTIMSKYSV